MSGLTWLHLSDWHQRGTGLDIDHKVVRDALLDDIKKRREIHPDLEKIDFIIFSGDLAFSGKEEEYLAAQEHLLDPVLEATGLKRDRLFIVPGNHDLDRKTFDRLPTEITKPLIREDEINKWLDDEDEERLSLMLRPFKAYTEFMKNYGAAGFPAYSGSFELDIDGKRIALLGFNSALMCGRIKDDKGEVDDKNKIIVGEPQVHEPLRKYEGADLRIVVLHHPFDWLTEQDCMNIERRLKQAAHFILCGHQHRQKVTIERSTEGECIIIPAGASYERRRPAEHSYPNAYNFVHLDIAAKKGTAYMRCWSNNSGKWREDIDACKGGRFDFAMPKELSLPVSTTEEESVETPKVTAVVNYHPDNPVFNVPFRAKGDGMVGREEPLQKVREQLTAGKRTAIGHTAAFQGLGGLGKTQLAVEYAYRFRAEYPLGVTWINADQEIEPQLIQIARESLWIHPESKPSDILEMAIRSLKTRSNCLVIFDNVEERAAIDPYLPAVGAEPHLLLTSRAPQAGFVPIDISLLDEERSLQLLLKESDRDLATLSESEKKAAGEIAGSLGGLPLAIEIAGAYLNYIKDCTFHEYRDFLAKNLKEAMKGDLLASFTGHETDLFLTLQVSKPVLDRAPLLNDILDILAWSGTAFMGTSLLAALLNKKETELVTPLNLGVSLRLLQKSQDGKRFDIHRLLRRVRQEQSPLTNREQWIIDTCKRLGDWFEERRDFTYLPAFEAELDHLKQWLAHVKPLSAIHRTRLTWLQAYPPYHWGRYLESQQMVQSAFALLSVISEDDLRLRADILNDLGFTSYSLGEYQKALEYGKQALEIWLKLLGEHHPDIANSFNNVGSTYDGLGDHKKALEYKLRALDILKKLFGVHHPDTANSFNNVGYTYGQLGDHKKAFEYMLRALEIRQQVLGENHPDTANSLNNVGTTYFEMGNPGEALPYCQRAFEIYSQLLGKQHPHTALAFYSYISSLLRLKRFKEAGELLDDYLEELPEDHKHYKEILNLKKTLQNEKRNRLSGLPKRKKRSKK